MANTILVTVGSLVGVLLGGALSLVTQRIVEHSASRRQSVTAFLRPSRGKLIALARADLERVERIKELPKL
jgi:hypothetical protein